MSPRPNPLSPHDATKEKATIASEGEAKNAREKIACSKASEEKDRPEKAAVETTGKKSHVEKEETEAGERMEETAKGVEAITGQASQLGDVPGYGIT